MTSKDSVSLGTKSIVINSFYSYLGVVATLAFGVFSKMLLVRVFSNTEEVGIFVSSQIIFGFALFAAGTWLSDATVYYISKATNNQAERTRLILMKSIKLGLTVSLVVVAGMLIFKDRIGSGVFAASEMSLVLMLWVIAIPFRVIASIIGSAYQALGDLKTKILYFNIMPLTIILLVLLACYQYNIQSLPVVVGGYVFAYGLFAVILICKAVRSIPTSDKGEKFETKILLSYGSPLFFKGLATWPLAAVPLILGAYVSLSVVPYYFFAISLAAMIYVPVAAIDPAAFPVWTKLIGNNEIDQIRKLYPKVCRWCFLLSTIIFIPIFFSGKEIVVTLFGEKYVELVPYLTALSLFTLMTSALGPMDGLLKALKETKALFYAHLLESVIAIALIIPLVSAYGVWGAIWTYLIHSMAGFLFYGHILCVRHKFSINFINNLGLILAFIAAAFVVYAINERIHIENNLVSIVIPFLIYLSIMVPILWLMGILTKKEISFSQMENDT